MSKKVFISYRSTEGLAADALINLIKELGDYAVWYDQALQGGQQWWDEIIRQIEQADMVVLALSDAYLNSEACTREREYAARLGKVVIPVQIDPDLDFNRLDAALKMTQIVRYHPYARDKDRLATALASADSSPLPSPLPEPPAPPIELAETPGAKEKPPANTDSNSNRVAIWVAIIGAAATVIAAIIGILPGLMNAPASSPTPAAGITVSAPAPNAGTITPVPTVAASSGAFDVSLIYGDRDSFTIHPNAESHLWGLTISSNIGTEIPAESFPALGVTGYVVEAGTCLQYLRAGQTPPRPRGCSDNATFSIELLDADIFWYDTSSNQLQDVVLRQDGNLISLCSSASRQCNLSAP